MARMLNPLDSDSPSPLNKSRPWMRDACSGLIEVGEVVWSKLDVFTLFFIKNWTSVSRLRWRPYLLDSEVLNQHSLRGASRNPLNYPLNRDWIGTESGLNRDWALIWMIAVRAFIKISIWIQLNQEFKRVCLHEFHRKRFHPSLLRSCNTH